MPQETQSDASPFHDGELAIQERLGVRNLVGRFATRAIRDYMPDQHRAFLAARPYVFLGSADEQGRPWASILSGQSGFLSSPTPKQVSIEAVPFFGDPATNNLASGASVGLLAIDLETRRRNRLSGRVAERGLQRRSSGFDIAVDQAFGNCPKYIQSRRLQPLGHSRATTPAGEAIRSAHFDSKARALLEQADTLFIASAYGDISAAPAQDAPTSGTPTHGIDVSHRGGKPGFLRLESDRSFLLPDFAGNKYFNTLGNIWRNPRCGFLFIDFARGDLLTMTGRADIIWDGPIVESFAGAERLLRFQAEEMIRLEARLPFFFTLDSFSPSLAATGQWT